MASRVNSATRPGDSRTFKCSYLEAPLARSNVTEQFLLTEIWPQELELAKPRTPGEEEEPEYASHPLEPWDLSESSRTYHASPAPTRILMVSRWYSKWRLRGLPSARRRG
jgi:hypothetical protein